MCGIPAYSVSFKVTLLLDVAWTYKNVKTLKLLFGIKDIL